MGWLRCDPDSIFKDHEYTVTAAAKRLTPAAIARIASFGELLPPRLAAWAWNYRLVAAPMQFHALVRRPVIYDVMIAIVRLKSTYWKPGCGAAAMVATHLQFPALGRSDGKIYGFSILTRDT